MKFEDDNDETTSSEDEIEFYTIEYMCEECDYKWKENRKPQIQEDFSGDDNRFDFDDSDMVCPMCGSFLVSRL